MANQTDFNKYLSNIEPSKTTIAYISSVQRNLRDFLKNHEKYGEVFNYSFLSGSYSKHTSIRPSKNDNKRDVDIIVVTKCERDSDSRVVLQDLLNVLLENDDYSSAEVQHHSIGIELSGISIDVVPVIEDKIDDSLYFVCDSRTGLWIKTDPKGHKAWSTRINQENNDAYKPLVKIIKWWRRIHCPKNIKYPKGIALEKIIADNIGDSSQSTEDLLIETMQNIVCAYKDEYADYNTMPFLADPSDKIENNDLLDGYGAADFAQFVYKLEEHLEVLNENGTDNDVWKRILGNEFPASESSKSTNSTLLCSSAPHRKKPMWPMARGGGAFISLKVFDPQHNRIEYQSDGDALEKGCSLHFRVLTNIKSPFAVKWQITNTGNEARAANCLRGDFEDSDEGLMGKREETSYSGSHSVQCFIIKYGICVAKSRCYIINIK